MSIRSLLIVDGNNQLHRAFHAYKRLSFQGESTAILYGMPNLVEDAIYTSRTNDVVIIWDGDRSAFRKNLLPEYKSRKSDKLIDREDLERQKREVMKLFYYLGVKQVWNSSQEGDDMIYRVQDLALNKKGFSEVIIMSNDHDFHQLLVDDRVSIMRYSDKLKYLYANDDSLKLLFGWPIKPNQLLDYWTLVGDKSDNIKGYPGIGPKKAQDFLRDHESIDKFLDSEYTHPVIKKKLLSEIKRLNRKLMSLELYYELNKEMMKVKWIQDNPNPKYNHEKYINHCKKFGLNKVMGNGFTRRFRELQEKGALGHNQTETNYAQAKLTKDFFGYK